MQGIKSQGFKWNLLAAAVVASQVATVAQAQETPAAESASDASMESVVVTATGFEQKITDAPASISVISADDLKTRQFTNLLDAVKYQEGVDIGSTRDKTGQGSISMRGLTGEYTLVLIDGIRQNNHGDIYPNNFGGNQFNHIPPQDTIERIEVIRGPASTLYGADALGGVINVITKRHTDEWGGGMTYGRSLQTNDDFGDDITTDFNVIGPIVPGVLTLGLHGSVYEQMASNPEFQPAVDPNGEVHVRSMGFGSGGRTVDSISEQYGVSLSWTASDNQFVRFNFDTSEQSYDNTPTFDINTGEISYPLGTKDNIESVWRDSRGQVQPRTGYAADQVFTRDWWSLIHEGDWGFATSSVSLSFVDTNNEGRTLPFTVAERLELQEMYDGTGEYAGMDEEARKALAEATFLPRPQRTLASSQYTLDARMDIPLSNMLGEHMLVIGGQVIDGELEDGVFGMEDNAAGSIQEQNMYSLFVEDNWTPVGDMTITAGVRYDNHDTFGSQVSPRLYSVYSLTDSWTVKGGVSTGYKTPQTTDLYDGITGFGGQGTSPFAGNPDLKPETSVNSEIAVYWTAPSGAHNFNVTLFQTDFEDKIASGDTIFSCERTGGIRPCVNLGEYDSLGYDSYSQKINVDEVEIHGLELAGEASLAADWSLRGNYTWTDSEQLSGPEEGQPLTNTAEHMANVTLDWQATGDLNVYLQAELRSDRYRGWDNVLDKPLYFENYEVLNLGAQLQINESVSVNGRINNLLDEDFTSYQTSYTDLDGDGVYTYATGRGVVSEVVFTDDYNVKDKARSFWVGVNVSF
ncbi:TonB-dependent receptor [Microbulbifer elongatus]|uniref:TonB-dependent receptor n=1 Tax=Microbulbifer elongatus TaxID=86173 RepID=A0ABT1P2Y1_9GAMM|nr:TonB-dependent receptor [Microbulbifer elongatus]MCQ3830466.1 TonB-dependent receptor [Microbulbifer elongatus]